jgi:hypothetical protein
MAIIVKTLFAEFLMAKSICISIRYTIVRTNWLITLSED